MEAERRQVTVLFADMVGFTAFSERRGEEAAYSLMRSLSKLMGESVDEQAGVVETFTGDGIMAAFGVPLASEDAPLRACRAAVAILERLNEAGPDLEAKYGIRPEMRIGLNTGPAVIGEVGGHAPPGISFHGDTINFAARLQTLAEPGSAIMSETTHRLVQGMVEAILAGEYNVKGKSEPQKAYRLKSVRSGATRFDRAMSRGLGTFVGREREFEVLDRALAEAVRQLRVVDLMAEPGMGKSRLLHEFRRRIAGQNVFILSGNCSPDSQQTAFLPFIEVVRGSFRIGLGDTEEEVAQKLATGLTALGHYSSLNLGLLLHLLGLKAPDRTLAGLDGVLIGLRTRELLEQLLEARSQLSCLILVIEDLHWIDSVSGELLDKIVNSTRKLRLLILHSRRPEHIPPWLDRSVVTRLHLEPLPAGDIRRLVQARLGVDVLPETLVHQVEEKAEGNPLFAEEILSFLSERGVLRTTLGKAEFDSNAMAAVLPASLQGLLTARVDCLSPEDRKLLQAASVIGRRFDTELLAAVVDDIDDIDARLAAMQALDLVRNEGTSNDYLFKHALVRDALYGSLLTEARTALHLRIAEEIERRSGNRLVEVAEALAYHFDQTDQAAKAFAYLSMAGSRSLSVYSLEEAEIHFSKAIARFQTNPGCANDEQIANVLVGYTLLQNALGKVGTVVDIADRFAANLQNLGDSTQTVLVLHQKVFSLCFMNRFQEALTEQATISQMAERLGDFRSIAYSLSSQILISSVVAPKSLSDQKLVARSALKAASRTDDAYIRSVVRWVIAIDEVGRGRMGVARKIAEKMSKIGRELNDPRPMGMGMGILGWIALTSDDYTKALRCADECLQIAYTPQERMNALGVKGAALVLLKEVEKAEQVLSDIRSQLAELGWRYELTLLNPSFGILAVLKGELGRGIRIIKSGIATARADGWCSAEDWAKLFLCEVYLEVLFPKEKPSLRILLKNIPAVVKILIVGRSSIASLVSQIRSNAQFDVNGHHIGRAEMILGLLYKGKKNRALALQHLAEANRILSQFGKTPTLARVHAALAELERY
jgi:class 3 adenylate cyclase/tetratricopeptide (TPR) repeat protein